MSAFATQYGASELKRIAHTYWILGLGISVSIHIGVVAACLQLAISGTGGEVWGPGQGKRPSIDIMSVPVIPGIGVAPHPAQNISSHSARKGVPVPVPDDTRIADNTIASQDDLRAAVDPGTEERVGTGTRKGSVTIPEDEAAPPPFVPVEKFPEIVRVVRPEYPKLALLSGLQGKVLAKLWVDRNGRVRQVVIVKSDYEIFNDAAIEAARQYVFTPAYMNNGPVSVWVTVPFVFKLK